MFVNLTPNNNTKALGLGNRTERQSLPQISTKSSQIKPFAFLTSLNEGTHRIEKMKERQEEIALRKLEKEAEIRKREEDFLKKLAKMERFEHENKKEVLAKSMQMS